MHVEAGFGQQSYPLRRSQEKEKKHSLPIVNSRLQRVLHLVQQYSSKDTKSLDNLGFKKAKEDDEIARQFAGFSRALGDQSELVVTEIHLKQAYLLIHRHVVGISNRTDRIISCGLAACAMVSKGMQVHLLVEDDIAIPAAERLLIPVFDALKISCGIVLPGADESIRKQMYKRKITLTSSRECALDFLRDNVNWPGRANSVLGKIDKMLGKRSHQDSILLPGLPCAIHVNIDSTLVDNARTPIVLTKDAHPMHEIEELKKSLEMVQHLQPGDHFNLIPGGAELEFTELCKRQLQAWAAELGGIWQIEHIAESMLALAIVVTKLIKPDIHYRIQNKSVIWLVQDKLVPGMAFYSRPFMNRMIEIREDCISGGQREIVSRASYQQIFNRYVHLCGTCHSYDQIDDELKLIYGLSSTRFEPEATIPKFEQVRLLQTNEHRMQWLLGWGASAEKKVCKIISFATLDLLQEAIKSLDTLSPKVFDDNSNPDLNGALEPGSLLLVLSSAMEYLISELTDFSDCPLQIVIAQRSIRYSEDRRNLHWLQLSPFHLSSKVLLLSKEDDIFTDLSMGWTETMGRCFGVKFENLLIERKLRQVQFKKAQELSKLRKELLNHDTSMQGLLSFSGRGLYE